jgi:transposase-like protein
MLDLNDVAVFVQVVRCGSFAEAARRLGIPPNTLSRRVQQLEAQLGTAADAAVHPQAVADQCRAGLPRPLRRARWKAWSTPARP